MAVCGLIRRRRGVVSILVAVLILFLIINCTSLLDSGMKQVVCEQEESVKREMEDIFYRSVASLRSLHPALDPFLCYDSLWSALGTGLPFAWKSFNEICLKNEDVSGIEEATLIRAFGRQGLRLSYFSSSGEYTVTESPSGPVRLMIILFERDVLTDNMRRVGWKHRLIPPDSCSLIDCFPPHLLVQPLPQKPYYKMMIKVPREEAEIQKYHYPDDWWKSSRVPKQCVESQLSA